MARPVDLAASSHASIATSTSETTSWALSPVAEQ